MERKKGKGRGARREAARVTASALVTQPGRGEARRGDSGAAACENDEDEARAPLAFTRGLSFRARTAATRSTAADTAGRNRVPRRAQGTMDLALMLIRLPISHRLVLP